MTTAADLETAREVIQNLQGYWVIDGETFRSHLQDKLAAALAAQREKDAAWHDKEAEYHNGRTEEALALGCSLTACKRQEHAEWHRLAAAAIRKGETP